MTIKFHSINNFKIEFNLKIDSMYGQKRKPSLTQN